jgi:hypothetical protein
MKKIAILLAAAMIAGCGSKPQDEPKPAVGGTEAMPMFSFAASEYPSWSTYMVAKKAGLINGTEEGEPGLLEKKWGVRLRLEIKDYDPCITMYGGGSVDAVCITNMDALNPALGRPSTVILPTSTSVGADKVIGVNWPGKIFEDKMERKEAVGKYLKGKKTYGLAKSVSEYVWYRGLESYGLNPKDYQYANLEPAAAATALQTGSKDVQVVCIWNPYALQTLRTQGTAKVLFSSAAIPDEVIDCVVMANESLKKPGGAAAAALICDTYYEVCKRLDNPKSADLTLKALGEDFSNLSVEDMRVCTKETRFYSTAQSGIKLFSNEDFKNKTMPTVVKTCQTIGVLEGGKSPTIGYGDNTKQLNFSTEYMQKAAAGK